MAHNIIEWVMAHPNESWHTWNASWRIWRRRGRRSLSWYPPLSHMPRVRGASICGHTREGTRGRCQSSIVAFIYIMFSYANSIVYKRGETVIACIITQGNTCTLPHTHEYMMQNKTNPLLPHHKLLGLLPHQKLLGGGFLTPGPFFGLIRTIISNRTGLLDSAPDHAPDPGSQILPGGRARHLLRSKKGFVWFALNLSSPPPPLNPPTH